MTPDPTLQSHQEWLGYVQPVGVVVSITALERSGAAINRNFVPLHRDFLALLAADRDGLPVPELNDFQAFAVTVLNWRPEDLRTPPEAFTISVQGYDDVLSPTYVVQDGDSPLLVVQQIGPCDFDREIPAEGRRWNASPQMRFERLLRETGVPTGLLVSPQGVRLVYAPKGESSGHITFKIADMVQVAGRPILAALHMLLSGERLFTGLPDQRLPAILSASRRYQNDVSIKLSGQVMEALFELLRGFQSAHDQTNCVLLAEVLRDDPNQVYSALLTVLLRLVFVLYAEDRDMLSSDPLYTNNYSVNGLFEALREDQGRYADTMDSRFGSWARLLTLFRLVYGGAEHDKFHIPGRKGYLFDPDRFAFLEGRAKKDETECSIPRVADGTVYRVLSKLLILNGERLSYRSLDVEQIGSVYEAMMGFRIERALGPCIAIKPKKKQGAPVTINLQELLAVSSAKRNEWFGKATDRKLSGASERNLKQAETIADLVAALDRSIAANVTRDVVPNGSLIFQPSPERRRSGSHYTPRSLTAPIVEATLEPVLKRLGENPTPEQILELKICDPAMGSGAFLVEACRQLGDALVEAWHRHKALPVLPPDEDELQYARRTVAQRCLYGVDKNKMAVDLAKLSLWLATLAKDHPFTFLDHTLRHGDSLLGLSARQIAAFHWEPNAMQSFLEKELRERIKRAADHRSEILSARDDVAYDLLAQKLENADQELDLARMAGDLVLYAFFQHEKNAKRKAELERVHAEMRLYVDKGDLEIASKLEGARVRMRTAEKPIVPFHWEIEFPEVFALDEQLRVRRGFDGIVGNPPFAGKNTLIDGTASYYIDWLKTAHAESHGNADVVAHFFRRAFTLLRQGGTFGLVATNTIGQGDTRSTGLRWICMNGGTIYRARKRRPWPGDAAVIVSVVNMHKGSLPGPYWLDGREVELITAYLFHAGGHTDPAHLEANEHKGFQGSIVLGMGFTFDDTDKTGVASPLAEMRRLVAESPKNAERIFPYIGGEEINNSPTLSHHRYVINFEDFPLRRKDSGHSWFSLTERAQREQLRTGVVAPDYPHPVAADWPDLLGTVDERVRPERENDNREKYRKFYWQYAEKRTGLHRMLKPLHRALAVNCGATPHLSFVFFRGPAVLAHSLVCFGFELDSAFAILQARSHEIWARFMASSMKDDLRYTPSDCFETFPFPEEYDSNAELDESGRRYYDFRADLMIRKNEGLTKTYNRFHNPGEQSSDIKTLRELHAAMDRAVLDAYGWSDIRPACQFFPEFEDHGDSDQEETGRTRAKKYRYRWPDEIHDEVLARLLALNQERAAVPRTAAGPLAAIQDTKPKLKSKKLKKTDEPTPSLFETQPR